MKKFFSLFLSVILFSTPIYADDFSFPPPVTAPTVPTTANIQTFITPGTATWSKPAGYNSGSTVLIECVGGGAGGRGGNAGGSPQPGGGGGSYKQRILSLGVLGATETVTVGVGGATALLANTGSGGVSSFGTWMSAYGGTGVSISAFAGPSGGNFSTAAISTTTSINDTLGNEGSGGTTGAVARNGYYIGGGGGGTASTAALLAGGSSTWGAGGGGGNNGVSGGTGGTSVYAGQGGNGSATVATACTAPGGGGGGGSVTGTAGCAGQCVITVFP